MIRSYIDQPLELNTSITPCEAHAHYLLHVMRVKEGDSVLLFNGRDGEWEAAVKSVKKHDLTLIVTRQTRAQTALPHLQLLFAPIKRGHGDMVVEKATELGITQLSPIITQHTVVNRVPVDRYEAIAREAAEQCERLSVPQIDEPQKLADALKSLGDTPLIFCAESGKAEPIATAISASKQGKLAIVTGPEGGFSGEEFEIIRAHKNVIPVHLGPRILRADTAAIAAISIVQAIIGDWKTARRD